jgi:hypothetical protein
MEERDTEGVLQVTDLAGQRRLRHSQVARCPEKAPLLCNSHKVAQVSQLHRILRRLLSCRSE